MRKSHKKKSTDRIKLPAPVAAIYHAVAQLEELYRESGRKFTPDGHLVGSIGEVVAADFCDVLRGREQFDFRASEPDDEASIEKADGGRDGALGAHGCFHFARGFKIVRARETVRNDRGFERDHGTRCSERFCDFRPDVKIWIHGLVLRRMRI